MIMRKSLGIVLLLAAVMSLQAQIYVVDSIQPTSSNGFTISSTKATLTWGMDMARQLS